MGPRRAASTFDATEIELGDLLQPVAKRVIGHVERGVPHDELAFP
jgi:hypothetical protein